MLRSADKKRLVAGISVMLAASSCLWAADYVTSDRLHFYVSSDGRMAELTYSAFDSTNVSAYFGALDVPASIVVDDSSLPVSGVTPLACVYCSNLTSVTLPEGVTRIGFGAFSDCSSLSSIDLPSSLSSLGDWTFYHDCALQNVELPAQLSRIGSCTFGFCSSLNQVTLPSSLRAIASNAFYYCKSLKEVVLPCTVDQVGEYAFAYCSSLQQITVFAEPIAVTPDVFEGVDVSQVRLVVPSRYMESYQSTDVWRDFQIIDGGEVGIPSVDSSSYSGALYNMYISGSILHLIPLADAPVLLFDLLGNRIAIASTHNGETQIPLVSGCGYIIKCGKESKKIFF